MHIAIEEINDVGINDILKDYDKEFLRIILKIWNEMSEDKEKKIKEKREEFIGILNLLISFILEKLS